MRLLYGAHIPFVALFLMVVVGLVWTNWKGRRP
jgi:hypothetical protein